MIRRHAAAARRGDESWRRPTLTSALVSNPSRLLLVVTNWQLQGQPRGAGRTDPGHGRGTAGKCVTGQASGSPPQMAPNPERPQLLAKITLPSAAKRTKALIRQTFIANTRPRVCLSRAGRTSEALLRSPRRATSKWVTCGGWDQPPDRGLPAAAESSRRQPDQGAEESKTPSTTMPNRRTEAAKSRQRDRSSARTASGEHTMNSSSQSRTSPYFLYHRTTLPDARRSHETAGLK